jgi:hypothetical protein
MTMYEETSISKSEIDRDKAESMMEVTPVQCESCQRVFPEEDRIECSVCGSETCGRESCITLIYKGVPEFHVCKHCQNEPVEELLNKMAELWFEDKSELRKLRQMLAAKDKYIDSLRGVA